MQVRRLCYSLGAEITGIDIREPLDDQSFKQIHAAFLEHSVLLFRGHSLIREQHIAFSRRFGELERIATVRPRFGDSDPGYPEILRVVNRFNPDQHHAKGFYNADMWHSDLSHWLNPAMASLLRAVEIPAVGGDTMFANLYLAYDTLSDGMKKLIDGQYGIHIGEARRVDDGGSQSLMETKLLNPPVAQPLVRLHPETGRKALYVVEKVKHIAGLTAEESRPLIEFLCRHATRPQFVYRHRWQKDDLLMWDNRCLLHNALGDYDRSQTRHMERTTVMGTPSGYVYEGPLL